MSVTARAGAAEIDVTRASSAAFRSMRLLLVEDNPAIAAVLQETLQSVGCTVICGESADDAARSPASASALR